MEEIPTGMVARNDYIQGYTNQSTMPPLPAQPLQYMKNFQSHIVGPGPQMQSF